MQDIQFDPSIELPVMEHFYTIQGEGKHSGRPAYFIRLSGCDVGCVWCDVKESWDRDSAQLMSVDHLVELAKESGAEYVVITGGEPALYDLTGLTEKLRKHKMTTGIETSGTRPLLGTFDWVCFSPKKFKAPIREIYDLADEFKVIIFHPSDLEWAEKLSKGLNSECNLYLQPEWGKMEEMMYLILNYVKKYPQWRISLQTHKFMNIP